VKGQTNEETLLMDSLEFAFSDESQAQRFEKAVRRYIAPEFVKLLKIESSPN